MLLSAKTFQRCKPAFEEMKYFPFLLIKVWPKDNSRKVQVIKMNLLESNRSRFVLLVGAVALFFLLFFSLPPYLNPLKRESSTYVWGVFALFALWLSTALISRKLNPFSFVIGEDQRPSTSIFKPFLWTIVVVFAYASIYAARLHRGVWQADISIPPNLLLAMAYDVVTAVAARSITETKVRSGEVVKPRASPGVSANPADGPGAVVLTDDGQADLSKIQTLVWTLIAIVTYLMAMTHTIKQIYEAQAPATIPFPDIDAVMMVLMGLGNAAYLGKKLVSTETPRLGGLAPVTGPKRVEIKLSGNAFGASQGGSKITIDGVEVVETPQAWSDTLITFLLPEKHPNGTDWSPPQTIRIGVIIGGRTGANELPFVVTA
jgi:IPT/TIG domain